MSVVIPEGDEEHRHLFLAEVVRGRLGGLCRTGHFRLAPERGALRFRWDLTSAGLYAVEVDNVPGTGLPAAGDHRPKYLGGDEVFTYLRKRLDPRRLDLCVSVYEEDQYWYVELGPVAIASGWRVLV